MIAEARQGQWVASAARGSWFVSRGRGSADEAFERDGSEHGVELERVRAAPTPGEGSPARQPKGSTKRHIQLRQITTGRDGVLWSCMVARGCVLVRSPRVGPDLL